jgi:hypothetical protein
MSDPRRMEDLESDHGAISDLLSVDADAHLQKLAACMFPTPAQLPVEMVRCALRRDASSVVVEVGRGRLVVDDDGAGITSSQWLELACALDSSRDAADREKAIDSLQSAASPGIGLLAVFIPGAESITIENSNPNEKMAMRCASGQVRRLDAGSKAQGTRISISRRRAPAEAEIKLLRELCAAAPGEITLNGRKIEKKALLRKPLAKQEVDLGWGKGPAAVAVPARGDICRVWLLDQGIPWQLITSAAYHGMVFEAALETAAIPSEVEFDLLSGVAGRLYHWLAGHYLAFSEKYQERIEELIFNKTRWTGDLQLLSAFTPFRLWRSRQRLNLEEVRRKAERSILYALPLDSDPDLYVDRHQEALRLTPLQKDFLLNHLGLRLVIPTAPMGTQGKMARLFFSALRKITRITDRLPRRRIQVPAAGETSAEEKLLCREMESCWLRLHGRGRAAAPGLSLTVVMAAGRGLYPAVWRHAAGENLLHLRRRHPLVLLAARSLIRDRANSELAFAALAPRHFLTGVAH